MVTNAIQTATEKTTDSSGLPTFPVRRFSVAEYQRMADAGILTADDRVELLAGLITPKMIHNPPHDLAVGLAEEALRSRLSGDWKIRTQSAIATSDSRPEPDVAVVRGPLRRYAQRQPESADIGLVVEVADSSLSRDRAKCEIYARAGLGEYWIVNLVDGQVEIYTAPTGTDPLAYSRQAIFRPGESVHSEFLGSPSLPVTDLLP